jgi:hypothetical protein
MSLSCWFTNHRWCIKEVAHYDAKLYSLYRWQCNKCLTVYNKTIDQRDLMVSDVVGSYLPKSKLRDRYGNLFVSGLSSLQLRKEVGKC